MSWFCVALTQKSHELMGGEQIHQERKYHRVNLE